MKTKPIRAQLMGPLTITGPDGADLVPRGRKAQAVLATLLTGRSGRRSRTWLQSLLWSGRAAAQASGSLRSCLHELRSALGDHADILFSDRAIAEIDLSRVHVDLFDAPSEAWKLAAAGAEFLEGLDVSDPEFTTWLGEQRAFWADKAHAANVARMQDALRESVAPPAGAPARPAAPEPAPADLAPDWDLALSVYPLENRTSEQGNGYVGHGLSEDLINRLQRLKWLPVVGTGRTFVDPQAQPGAGLDLSQGAVSGSGLANQLGAQFYLEGSLTPERNTNVVRFRLCDAASTQVVWSDTYDLAPFLSGESVDMVFDQVVGAIDRSVSQAMLRRVAATPNQPAAFLDQIWRARWHVARLTREDSDAAHTHLQAALKMQPHAPEALIQMAFWHLWRTWVSREGELGLSAGEHFARQALELDPDDGRCYALLGIAEAWRRNHSNAIMLLQQAVELNPNLAIAHHQLGSALNHADRPDEAMEPIAQALRYSPRDQLDFAFQTEMAVALARMSHFEEAFVRASRALLSKPRYWYGHLVRIFAAENLGDPARIQEARAALERSGAQITDGQLAWLPFDSDEFPEQLRALL